MTQALNDAALDQLFRTARTYNAFTGEVSDETLHQLYALLKFGPTEANTTPARIVFVKSAEAKAKLGPALSEGNYAKTMAAPAVAIIGYDMRFFDKLPVLFPHAPGAKDWFADPAAARETAFRNASLQGGYFLLAARALGLDVGPMSGFDAAGVKAEFFPDSNVEPNYILNLGYGSDENLFARSPRLSFDEAAQMCKAHFEQRKPYFLYAARIGAALMP